MKHFVPRKQSGRRELGMSEDGIYYLVAGEEAHRCQENPAVAGSDARSTGRSGTQAVVIYGRNRSWRRSFAESAMTVIKIFIIGSTSQMATYMRAYDVLYSSRGLSSTEAAVIGIPLIHRHRFRGVNKAAYFRKHGMCLAPRMIESVACQRRR